MQPLSPEVARTKWRAPFPNYEVELCGLQNLKANSNKFFAKIKMLSAFMGKLVTLACWRAISVGRAYYWGHRHQSCACAVRVIGFFKKGRKNERKRNKVDIVISPEFLKLWSELAETWPRNGYGLSVLLCATSKELLEHGHIIEISHSLNVLHGMSWQTISLSFFILPCSCMVVI